MTNTNINTTINNTPVFNADTFANVKDNGVVVPVVGTIDFSALVRAYKYDVSLALDIEEIFACVCKALYWLDIRKVQRRGITNANSQWVQSNMLNYLNTPEYVESRIQSNLSKVIRKTCRLSMRSAQAGLDRVLVRRFDKDDEGFYSMFDAQTLAMDIAAAYERNVGKELFQKRW